jgi:hypothetical protein
MSELFKIKGMWAEAGDISGGVVSLMRFHDPYFFGCNEPFRATNSDGTMSPIVRHLSQGLIERSSGALFICYQHGGEIFIHLKDSNGVKEYCEEICHRGGLDYEIE